jgi:hypothetical protein
MDAHFPWKSIPMVAGKPIAAEMTTTPTKRALQLSRMVLCSNYRTNMILGG